MSFAPQQNWPAYRAFVESKQIENERARSAAQTQHRYAEIVDHVRATKNKDEPARSLGELKEKLALRSKLLVGWRLVTVPTSNDQFDDAIIRVAKLLESHDLAFALIGGLASSIRGRFTHGFKTGFEIVFDNRVNGRENRVYVNEVDYDLFRNIDSSPND